MSTVIKVENLSKRYRIGQKERYKALRDTLSNLITFPFHLFSRSSNDPHNPYPISHNPEYIWALKDVSFEVKRGEVIGIIGRNGAGKTTLLKVLSRITEPTQGKAIVRGRVGSLLEVGTGFHPELTGRENIYLNGAILGMTRREINKKFDQIVSFAEVEKFIDTPLKRYSSGMQVRLAFAIAAHLEPEILLVDEVLAVGDAAFQAKCFSKIEGLALEGRTILLVSHNLLQVRRLANRSLLLDEGAIVLDAETEKVTARYLSTVGNEVADDESQVKVCSLERFRNMEPLAIEEIEVHCNGTLTSGSEIEVAIRFVAKVRLPLVAFGLRCYDSTGLEIFRLGTYPFSKFDFLRDVEGPGQLHCRISRLPLVGGVYYLKLVAWIPGGETLVEIDKAVTLRVSPTNAYGGIVTLDRSRGLIVVDDSEWFASDSC